MPVPPSPAVAATLHLRSSRNALWAIRHLRNYTNNISDLSLLVAKPGIADGDLVNVNNDPIDGDAQADDIQMLKERGVQLGVWC